MAFNVSGVAASTDTYSCVIAGKLVIASGNCAFVTRNVEIFLACNKDTNLSISGYMMGSPTRDNAQCFGSIPSANRCGNTPGTPFICLIMPLCSAIAPVTSV
ncbi:hypothetical protein N9L76_02775 [bacterium]|nr:hypothetical protein [bacterium]